MKLKHPIIPWALATLVIIAALTFYAGMKLGYYTVDQHHPDQIRFRLGSTDDDSDLQGISP